MSKLQEQMEKYKFYHIIEVEKGIFTPGIQEFVPAQQMVLRAMRTLPIKGRRVLDIGCRDGLFSFEAERLGAAEVIAIDNNLSEAATEFLIPHLQSRVQMQELNLYDLTPERFGHFDVVIFAGVLYHLRYPNWGLKKIIDVMKDDGHLLIETGIYCGMDRYAILYCPIENESPYEGGSISFFNIKGLSDTLRTLGVSVRQVQTLNPHNPAPQVSVPGERPGMLSELWGLAS